MRQRSPKPKLQSPVARCAHGRPYATSCSPNYPHRNARPCSARSSVAEAAAWSIVITGPAEHDLRRLPLTERSRILIGIDRLTRFPHEGDLRKLTDEDNLWALRVGDRRVRFRPVASMRTIEVLRVLHRREAYR